ncbi:transglutaminase family protein [Gymnodinialimonas sp.]
MDRVDLGQVMIEAERIVDPDIDADALLAELDQMVRIIQVMLPPQPTDWDRLETIRQFIYEPGVWNEHRAFGYDHEDPYGQDPRNRLLSDYLEDRRGNCITMPFLFIILGQRLGLDVVPAMAPLHVYVRFTDAEGETYNLETTSGAGLTRDAHYRELLPITDTAITNRVYMAPLNQREAVAVIASVVVDNLIAQGDYPEAIETADLILRQYPQFVYLMVKRGTAAYHLIRTEFHANYATYADVPNDRRQYLQFLQTVNDTSFANAEALGWQPLEF